MRNKFKAINSVELTEREFTFEDLRVQNDIGVILNDYETVLMYDTPHGDQGFNEDMIIVQYVGLNDIEDNELYEYDKVEIKEHAFQKKSKDDLTGMNIDGTYYVKWSENMELILVRHPNDESGWLLNRNLAYVTKTGNAYLDGLDW